MAAPARAVDFPQYRRYERTRQDANNAMMALMAGSKLAAHTLQLTSGSHQLLPDIFPGVEHIGYFRLRTDTATQLLLDTGHHLGAVAVPYALAVHEDFVTDMLELVQDLGRTRVAPGDSLRLERNRVVAWNMHESLFMTLGERPPARGSDAHCLEQFHLLREMRNCHIHNGGDLSEAARLLQEAKDISGDAAADWERLARRSVSKVVAGTELRFTIFDVFTSFAVTKSLGRIVNDLLQRTLHRSEWADMCLRDYASLTSKNPRSDPWMRSLIGYASKNYSSLALTEQELADAAALAGMWRQGRALPTRRAARGARRKRNPGNQTP